MKEKVRESLVNIISQIQERIDFWHLGQEEYEYLQNLSDELTKLLDK